MKCLLITDKEEEQIYFRNIFATHFSKMAIIPASSESEYIDIMSYQSSISVIIIDCDTKSYSPMGIANNIYEDYGNRPILFIGTPVVLKAQIKDELG